MRELRLSLGGAIVEVTTADKSLTLRGRAKPWGILNGTGASMLRRLIVGSIVVISAVLPAMAGTPGIPVGVPGPIVGAGVPGLILAGAAAFAWWRHRRSNHG